MPNRIIKESAWSSESLCKVSILAQGFFFRLLPLPDDHGCFDARPAILRARLFPLNYGQVSERQIEQWMQELIAVDCIRVWMDSGVRYGIFPGWSKHQNVRSLHHRKTPAPPLQVVASDPPVTNSQIIEVTGTASDSAQKAEVGDNQRDSNCVQLVAVAPLNPNPNPKIHIAKKANEYSPEFITFWENSSRRGSKLEAWEAWEALNPDAELQQKMNSKMAEARASPDWADPKYILHVVRWIKRRGWEVEYTPPPDNVRRMTAKPTPIC